MNKFQSEIIFVSITTSNKLSSKFKILYPSTLTSITIQLTNAVDHCKLLSLEELDHELDYKNDIFEFLENKFPDTFDFSTLSQIDKEFLIDNYNDMHYSYDYKKRGIENNGLGALIQYTIELIQRERRELTEKGHDFQLEINPNYFSGRADEEI